MLFERRYAITDTGCVISKYQLIFSKLKIFLLIGLSLGPLFRLSIKRAYQVTY